MTGSFRIPVSDLIAEQGRRRAVEIDTPIDWELELSRVGPRLTADLALESASGGIVARGKVRTMVTHSCHRCLTTWEEPLELELLEVLGLGDDPDEYPLDGEVADLEQPIRDAVMLEIPLSPTCREGCLGLCAVCGADLNTGSCPGHDDEPDSPFASLRGLLDT